MLVTALAALAALELIVLVRSVPWVQRRVVAGEKPWGCDPCMSAWASLVAVAVLAPPGGGGGLLLVRHTVEWVVGAWLPAAGGTLLAVAAWSRLDAPGAPPALPPPGGET